MIKTLSKTKGVLMASLIGVFSLTGCSQIDQRGTVAKPFVMQLGDVVELAIQPQRVACESTVPMQCMQVTDVNTKRTFLIWYNAIDGFNHVNGFSYLIKAKPLQGSPQKDPSAQQWSLIQIISQNPA